MSDLFLDTNPSSPATPQAVKRTDLLQAPGELTLAEVSMFGAGTSNHQGVISLRTLNPGSSTGLVECMRIHTNGFVGIGTPAPTQALEVVGTVKATAFQGNGAALTGVTDPLKVSKTGDTMTGALSITAAGTGLSITNNAAVGGTLAVAAGANLATASGNVGIGTTTPGAKLEVAGTVKATAFQGDGAALTGISKMDFQRQRASFPTRTGGAQSIDLAFVFPSNIRRAEAAINGFNIGFTNDDHHLLRTEIDTSVTSITLNTVTIRVTFSLRDNSGTFDDPYNGFVDVMAIVERV